MITSYQALSKVVYIGHLTIFSYTLIPTAAGEESKTFLEVIFP